MFDSIRLKSFLVFALVHAGFITLGVSLHKLSGTTPANPAMTWAIIGLAVAYFGFVLGSAFLYLPFVPWIKRYHFLANWREWIWAELPTLLALIPLILALGKVAQNAWAELKRHHRRDELDLQKFAKIVSHFADQANGVLQEEEPSASRANKPRKPKSTVRHRKAA
ncbi:MAG TPA: hypothetical protein PLH57_02390 [Oligoflexia bacterium]|nr:hypothetical protein [Oligoflexia bacterium]